MSEQKHGMTYSLDYFWLGPAPPTFQTMAGVSHELCRSECVQGGEHCPFYNNCSQKYMLRNILS